MATILSLILGCSGGMDTVKARYLGQRPVADPVAVTAQKDSKPDEPRLSQAKELYGRGSLDSCLTIVDRELSLNPDRWQAYYLKGMIQTERDEFEQSLETLRMALRHCPNTATDRSLVYVALGNCYERSGQTARAQQSFITAFNLDPLSEQARSGIERLKPLTSLEGK